MFNASLQDINSLAFYFLQLCFRGWHLQPKCFKPLQYFNSHWIGLSKTTLELSAGTLLDVSAEFTFQHRDSVCNACLSLSEYNPTSTAKGCSGFSLSVSLSFLICCSNNGFLKDVASSMNFKVDYSFDTSEAGGGGIAGGLSGTLRQWLADLIWCLISHGWALVDERPLALG